MALEVPGRIIFAVAIVGFGVLSLLYIDSVHQLQPLNLYLAESTPGYAFLALLTGVVLVAAGLAIMANVGVSIAGLLLSGFLALWIVVLHVPSAFLEPALLRSPWWIRTFETLSLAGAALILAGLASSPVREPWVRAGRIAFGISLPVFGVLHFIYPESVAAVIPAWYPWPLFLAYLTGAGHFAAGIAILAGVLPRLAATLAGCMYALWALSLHLPRVISNPAARSVENPAGYGGDRPEFTSLFVCVAFWGAAWIVAGSLAKREGKAAAVERECAGAG